MLHLDLPLEIGSDTGGHDMVGVAVRTQQKVSRAILFGAYGCGNLGNESSFAAVLGWLRDGTELEISSITREPETVAAIHGVESVSMFGSRTRPAWLPLSGRKLIGKLTDLLHLASVVRPGDVVVIPGTGIFEQKLGGPPWGLSLSALEVAWACRLRGARIAFVGIGASLDTRRIVRWMTRATLRRVGYLSFRNSVSRDALGATGIDVSSCDVFPDVAFGGVGFELDPARPVRNRPGLKVGVGLLAYGDTTDPDHGRSVADAYEQQMVEFCDWLISHDHQVELLLGDATDLAVADRVLNAVRQRHEDAAGELISYTPVDSFPQLIDRMRLLDVIVAARYHNLIFGLITGRPIMGISYAEKSEALLGEAGLRDYSIPLEDATSDRLSEVFGKLVANLESVEEQARAYRQRARELSEQHRQALLSFVLGGRIHSPIPADSPSRSGQQ